MMISDYYYLKTLIFCITDRYAVNARYANTIFVGNIHGMNKITTSTVSMRSKKHEHKLSISNAFCATNRLHTFPTSLSKFGKRAKNVLFTLGEDRYEGCNAIAIAPNTKARGYIAKSWRLPDITKYRSGNALTFST
eukprot:CAMPEP_0197058124 /NCGR_PEP_ID=MMETSP1384-20130603/104346_1 /TAXON_ID=29189 /ORGANISM="Ammonia sp." /LENGTH=135 /DNA_ID=CAMNT_0042492765 /DNA_START=39 /DNA_END=442 /DNA_ORIENTATION=+